jgi:hypothetical protein
MISTIKSSTLTFTLAVKTLDVRGLRNVDSPILTTFDLFFSDTGVCYRRVCTFHIIFSCYQNYS